MPRKILPVPGIFTRLTAVMLPGLAAVFFAFAGQAQQLSSPDQLQQLLQRQGGQSSGSGSGTSTGQIVPQTPDILIQPAQQNQSNQRQLPPSRLEQIMSSRAGTQLRQFGYDRFGTGQAVLVPQTGAIQDDYVLGPGDEVVVSLRGQENNEFRTAVDRNGQVVLPRLNPIAATGRSFGSFREDVESAVRRAFVATSAFVSIGRVRQISVLVAGEVNNPGQRLVTGLSSAVDALLLSGGVKKTGSLRNVRIQRGGREYRVDLYDVLTGRGGGANLRLSDGDRIVVPPLGRTVAVSGLVRQPGIYELAPGQSSIAARALLALAGGQEVRGNYRISVLRIMPDGRTALTPLANEGGTVGDSEILFVQLGADQSTSQATISGGLGMAGPLALGGASKLSDYVRAPGALGLAPYSLFGIISRKNSRNLLRELLPFTPVAVVNGTEDSLLQSEDIVRPISVKEAQMLTRALCAYLANQQAAEEAMRNPTANDNSASSVTGKTIKSAGSVDITHGESYRSCNPDDAASRVFAVQGADGQVVSAIQRPAANQFGDTLPQYFLPGGPGQNQAQTIQQPAAGLPGGIPQQSNFGSDNQPAVPQDMTAEGVPPSLPPFSYPMDRQRQRQTAAPNFQDQALQPGQVALNREVTRFADLAQQLGVTELVLANFLLDHQVTLSGAVRGPGRYFVGPSVNLPDLVAAAGGTANWADTGAIEVVSTAVDTDTGRSITSRVSLSKADGTYASYRVRPQDVFRFNTVFTANDYGTATVQGQVRSAGDFQIRHGERLSTLLMRAGGLTSTAYPYGAVFLRRSVANLEHDSYLRAAKEAEDQLLVAMTRVGTDKISPETFSAMQNFITDLRNQKAVGRISVNADPSVLAAHPEMDPLLEPGDLIYVPQRPSTISVLGQVQQPGSYLLQAHTTIREYIARAGGYSPTADESDAYVVLPDGSARKVETSWLNFTSNDLPPGSAIVVPRDVTPLDLRQIIIDTSQIFSQLAVSIASVAVISRY